tara:strand:+ start:472 stop:780 length:309 start_codon:yes stop_codon:yes gene_type:complete
MEKNWLLIISLLLISCVNWKSKEIEFISKKDFAHILIDIDNAIPVLSKELVNSNNPDSVLLIQVLANYNYSYELYKQTLMFYIEHPEDMIEILKQVRDSLEN